MNDESLEQIQTKISFLERANAELSDVVIRQQQEIRVLEMRLKAVIERLSGGFADEPILSLDQERPPHY